MPTARVRRSSAPPRDSRRSAPRGSVALTELALGEAFAALGRDADAAAEPRARRGGVRAAARAARARASRQLISRLPAARCDAERARARRATAAATARRSVFRPWSPRTTATSPARRRPAACRTGRARPARSAPGRSPPRARAAGSAPAGAGAPRRLQREREAEHADGAGRLGGAAGHARARGATAGEQRQRRCSSRARRCSTTAIQAASSCRAGAGERRPGDAVGLLDEHDADRLRERDAGRRHDVGRVTPPPAPWPSTSAARAPSAGRRCTRAGPCGVSTS